MGQDTEELTTTPADIEATRTNLTRDIDELTDKVTPSRVLDRRKEAAKGRMGSFRDKVMGSAGSAGGNLSGTASSATGSISGTATGALDGLESRTQGNPLAAGVVAFGAGMLISALIPASEKEAQAARKLTEVAQDHIDAGGVIDRERDAHFAGGHHVHGGFVAVEDFEDAVQKSVGHQHARGVYVDGGDLALAGDRFHDVVAVHRFGGDARSGHVGAA